MPKFLTTHGVAFEIENLIVGAKRQLVLVSPYLRLSKTLTERLRDTDRRNVPITLVYGKRSLDEDEQRTLASLRHLSLYFFDNLHAKCYFNEHALILTSMNLYEFSEKTNREMGVLVQASEEVYREATQEAQSIIKAAQSQSAQGRVVREEGRRFGPKFAKAQSPGAPGKAERGPRGQGGQWAERGVGRRGRSSGSCIRCGRGVVYNPATPFCRSCFGVWAQFEDEDYAEQYCHGCGRAAGTTMRKPECYRCYSR